MTNYAQTYTSGNWQQTGVFDASTDGTWQERTQFRSIAERSAGKRGLPTHSLSENQFQPKLNLAGTRGRAGDFGH